MRLLRTTLLIALAPWAGRAWAQRMLLTTEEGFRRAELILEVKVEKTARVPLPEKDAYLESDGATQALRVRCTVTRAWKGKAGRSAVLYTAVPEHAACAAQFEAGKRYIFTAYSSGKVLVFDACKDVHPADDDTRRSVEASLTDPKQPVGPAPPPLAPADARRDRP